jgi:hypothetical protein
MSSKKQKPNLTLEVHIGEQGEHDKSKAEARPEATGTCHIKFKVEAWSPVIISSM